MAVVSHHRKVQERPVALSVGRHTTTSGASRPGQPFYALNGRVFPN